MTQRVVALLLVVAACHGAVAIDDSHVRPSPPPLPRPFAPALPPEPKPAPKPAIASRDSLPASSAAEGRRGSIESCAADAEPFDEAVLRERLTALAAPALDGRASGSDGERAARKLIADRFACLGVAPAGDNGGYEQAFTDGEGHATANLVARLAGASDDIIVVGAHHDHLGNGYLGANDNGSGVIGLLAIAQAIRQRADAPKRTLVFVTFSAEEQGLVGSTYFVAHPPADVPLDKVVQYINLDMLGSYASRNAVYAFGAFSKLPSRTVLEKLVERSPKLNVGLGGHSVRGDQLDFCKRGIPYVFLWTPDKRCYHEKCDTADRIDYRGMAAIAALAGGLVEGLADSDLDLAAMRGKRGCGV